MVSFVDRAKMTTATTGTGPIVLGVAVAGFQSFAAAGVQNGAVVRYVIEDTAGAWEIGLGTYSAGTLSRGAVESSIGGALSLSGNAVVYLSVAGADLAPMAANTGRNLLHNGMFRVQQRGQGPWSTTASYTADRWVMVMVNTPNTATVVALADADRVAIGDEAATSAMQFVVSGTTGAADVALVTQRLESVQRFSGKTVTLSFWAKATVGTPQIGYDLTQSFGTGGGQSAQVAGIGAGATPPLTTAWTRYSVTIPIPSSIGKTFGANAGTDLMQMRLWFSNASTTGALASVLGVQSGTFQIWGVQLEVGTVATALDKPDYAIELANCQRFYYPGQTSFGGYGVPVCQAAQTVDLPVPMRATPTITPVSNTNSNVSSFAYSVLTNSSISVGGLVTATGAWSVTASWTASADL